MFVVVTERLTFLRAIDPTEAETLSALDVKDFNRVVVENGDNGAGEAVGL